MVVQSRIMTTSEFEEFVERPENADRRFELINGELVEKLPAEEHAVLAALLTGEIYIYLKANPRGRLAVEPHHQLPEDNHNARLPDIAFTRNERALPLVRQGAVPQMPDLAIEIQSPGDKPIQMRAKALYYLQNGSRMVWLFFTIKRQVEVHTAEEIILLNIDDMLDGAEVMPGFNLALKDIFKN